MKDNVVAKLCSQCEEMYGDALKHLQRETLKGLWDREWIPRVAGKQAGYHALAEYHQSRVSGSCVSSSAGVTCRQAFSIAALRCSVNLP